MSADQINLNDPARVQLATDSTAGVHTLKVQNDTAHSDALTLQGYVDALEQPLGTVAAGTAATKSQLAGGVYNTTAPAPTDGQGLALQLSPNGSLLVSGKFADDGAMGAVVSYPLPVGGLYQTTPPTYTTGDRTQIQADSRGAIYFTLRSPDSAGHPYLADNVDGVTVVSTNARIGVNARKYVFNGTDYDRATTPNIVIKLPSAAANTNPTLVKNAKGKLYKMRGYNASASLRYLHVYNKASAPTVGTDTPVFTITLKASDIFDIDFGGDGGLHFATGISIGFSTGVADNDSGNLTAGDITGFVATAA